MELVFPGAKKAADEEMECGSASRGNTAIANPALFVTESSDSFATFYLQVLRTAAGEMASASLLTGQAQLTPRMKELFLPREVQLGIEMIRLEDYEAFPVHGVN